MTTLATLQTRLTEAEDALHLLITGQLANRIQMGDISTSYAGMSKSELEAYIASLNSQIAQQTSGTNRRSPINLAR